MSETLEDLIRRHVVLGKLNNRGFFDVKCAVCNDYKERGGFKFEASSVFYTCFNCSTKAFYNPSSGRFRASKKFKEVLSAFGIPEAEVDSATGQEFFKTHDTPAARPTISLPVDEVALPAECKLLATSEGPWSEVAREYLLARKLDPASYPYYVIDIEKYAGAYLGRIFIPYTFRNKIVYWQARALDSSIQPRYKNPVVEKNNVFFNMDEIYRYTSEPLLVTEGPLDALSIGVNTIALIGSTLNEFKWSELKKAAKRRPVIFVIDKNINGHKLALKVLEQENMSIVLFPDNIEDANDALQKLGKIWLRTYLTTNAASGFQGKVNLNVGMIRGT